MNRTPVPIRDAQGMLRPDLDFRDVPLSTMAQYLGCSPDTLYRRVLKGVYSKGIIKIPGGRFLYRPRVLVSA
jgi:hypothetical protein